MSKEAGFDWESLFRQFPLERFVEDYAFVPANRVPQPYHRLLVHDQHMTVTVEQYHRQLVDVLVLEEHQDNETYARKILLKTQKTGRVVQCGLVRIHLNYCSPAVRTEILAKKTPLGRILIEHNVLRRIEPIAFLKVSPGPEMMEWFELRSPTPTFGRLALIHCDDQPAVELLEIVAPEERSNDATHS